MKPVELVSLIEEAAGTSLYQQKREQAQNHISKKDLKLQEIENILKVEVTPKLEQLHRDKNSLDEHKAQISDLEKSEKLLIAFKYHDYYNIVKDPKGRGAELKSGAQMVEVKISKQESKIAEINAQIDSLEQKNKDDDGALKSLKE